VSDVVSLIVRVSRDEAERWHKLASGAAENPGLGLGIAESNDAEVVLSTWIAAVVRNAIARSEGIDSARVQLSRALDAIEGSGIERGGAR
jgi:hypothetical protein